jgi:hypothetical protein
MPEWQRETRPERKQRLQQARDVGEGRLNRARKRLQDRPSGFQDREPLLVAMSALRSALVISYWDSEWGWDLVAEGLALIEQSQEEPE